MKKVMLSILPSLLLSSAVLAEPFWAQKPVQCGPAQELVEITKNFGEVPFLSMNGITQKNDGTYIETILVISVGLSTKSWSVLEFSKDKGLGCILATGRGFDKLRTLGIDL
jgi:hypothetical protein